MQPSLKIPLKQAVEFLEEHGFGYEIAQGVVAFPVPKHLMNMRLSSRVSGSTI